MYNYFLYLDKGYFSQVKKKYDRDFIKMSERKPEDYELVLFRDVNGYTTPGWLSAKVPVGMRVHYLDEIVEWKKYIQQF